MTDTRIRSQFRLRFWFGIAAGLTILLFVTGCQKSPERLRAERAGLTVVGEVEHNTEAANNTVARALGLDVLRFDYTLKKGRYEIDVWLEQWDKGSSEPERLTYGKGTTLEPIEGGSVVVGIMDPATTRSEFRKTWRIRISRKDIGGGSFSKTTFLPNPLYLKNATRMSSVNPDEIIALGNEVILVTWGVGENVIFSGHQEMIETNDRTVYLKMKVSPLERE